MWGLLWSVRVPWSRARGSRGLGPNALGCSPSCMGSEVALKERSGSPVTCLPHLWHGDSSKWINMLCSGQKGSAHGRGDGELTSTRGFTYQRAVALETQCGQVCESRQEPFPGGPAAGLVQGHVERNADDKEMPKQNKIQKDTCTPMFIAALFTMAETQK